MKILLTAINAKYIHSNLAVRSLQAYAGKCGYRVGIAEYTINHRAEKILEEIYRQRPDVLFFSCYIWNIGYVREIAEEFHKLCPGVPIWAGGPEVSYGSEQFLRENSAFTGIIAGEGERAFSGLCGYYERDTVLEQIDGILYRQPNGSITVQPPRGAMRMDEIPFCYSDTEELKNRIIYYESSRGCPFACSYCLSSLDQEPRFRSLSLVYDELQFFLDRRVAQVKFVDRTFNCNHAHAQAIWQYLLEHDNGVTNFHFEIAADLLNGQEIELLEKMRPGQVQLEIGVQTVNFETLREIHRSMSVSRVEEAAERLRRAGNIHLHLDLIAGLPMENYESFQKSFDEIYALKPHQLQLGFLKALKGSYLREHADEYGLVYQSSAPYEVMGTKWLSFDEILRLRLVEEMLEIHYNSGQFTTALTLLEKHYESAFAMYLDLGRFYREAGYADRSQSRIRRTEIFMEFARRADYENRDLYQEALIFDLYRIENAKSRPNWAPDLSRYKKQTAAFLRERGYEKKYCHLEPFWRLDAAGGDCGQAGGTCRWILFDYERRDPITNEAGICEVSLGELV